MHSFIVIGQGLAGSAFAHTLRKRGITDFIVIDPGFQASSSQAAAGVFNPITGVRWNKTWMADELFPCLQTFYREVEQFIGTSFLHQIPIVQYINSIEEQNFLMGKSALDAYKTFVKIPETFPFQQHKAFGAVELQQSGFIDVMPYLDATRKWLRGTRKLIEANFESEPFQVKPNEIIWGNLYARHAVFCTGLGQLGLLSDYHPPLIPLKGEMIAMQTKSKIPKDIILKNKVLCVPVGLNKYWVGSTYDFQFKDLEPSEEGKKMLNNGFFDIFPDDAQVVDHWASARPTSPDRRPLAGKIPGYDNLFILNGLGTKGVSLSPFLAEALAGHILEGNALPIEASPVRFLQRK